MGSLFVFVGLTISAGAKDQPTNHKESVAMVEANRLFEDWQREGADGTPRLLSFKWAIKDAAISIHSTGGNIESDGVIGFDAKNGKVVSKAFGKTRYSDTEWSFADGKLIEKIRLNGMQNGEPRQFSFARSVRSVDESTMETTFHRVSAQEGWEKR